MPTYKFLCRKCNLNLEHELTIRECDETEKFPKCPGCRETMTKVWIANENGSGFILSGRGWFKKGGY